MLSRGPLPSGFILTRNLNLACFRRCSIRGCHLWNSWSVCHSTSQHNTIQPEIEDRLALAKELGLVKSAFKKTVREIGNREN